MTEVADALGLKVVLADDVAMLHECSCMLVYLNGRTWTSGETSEEFAVEVHRAMSIGTPLLLCHEMEGFGGQEALAFATFG